MTACKDTLKPYLLCNAPGIKAWNLPELSYMEHCYVQWHCGTVSTRLYQECHTAALQFADLPGDL